VEAAQIPPNLAVGDTARLSWSYSDTLIFPHDGTLQ